MVVRLGSPRALVMAGVLASTGSAVVGARNYLTGQAAQARIVIPRAWDIPPKADGIYPPDGGPVRRWERRAPVDLDLMIFGDSTATGYGCRDGAETPGALLARGLAERFGAQVRLSTKAIVGASSRGLASQVDAMLVTGPAPNAAVIMIGANDVTTLNGIGPSARRLGAAVRRLRSVGAEVVVGTCPDLGVITAIPQPLRWTARSLGLRLARAQAAEVRAAGGVPVPLADLLAPHFHTEAHRLFAEDRYHPSAAGYALAANKLLPALFHALGDGPTDVAWAPSPAARPRVARLPVLGSVLGRRSSGGPAPITRPAS